MPQSVTIAAFVFGAVLVLIAILHGGGFKIFGAEVTGSAGIVGRLIAGFLGLILLAVGLNGSLEKSGNQPTKDNATNQMQGGGTTAKPADEPAKPPVDSGQPVKNQNPQNLVAAVPAKDQPADAQSTATEQPVNISGTWRDPTGSVYQIAQQGDAVTIRVSGVNGVGAATGVVRGHQLEDMYEIQYVNGTRSAGRCRATVSPETNVIRGTCVDNVYGQSENILMR